MTSDARTLAHELLDAYGRADGSAHALEARLDALTGYRSTQLLLDVARERRNAPRAPFTIPRDPGLRLARTLAAPCASPHVERPAGTPNPRRGARKLSILGDLVLVVAATAPLVWLGVWFSTKGATA